MTLVQNDSSEEYCYTVPKIDCELSVDGNWDKPEWKHVKALSISNDNNWGAVFKPRTEAKLCYNSENLYVIFRVQDQYVKCVTDKHNGPVWQDSCVEFFFSPNPSNPNNYFNCEINCAGYAYMAYQRLPRVDFSLFRLEDIESTKIAHSFDDLVKQEIEQPTEWILEYRLPFKMLARYAEFPFPVEGDIWVANFFKCAENNSHPHWLS